MKPLYTSRDGSINSRGWLFLGNQGGPCDQRCAFCYYAFQEDLVFFDQWTLMQHANLFRHYYQLDACDITGGEPTIHPQMPAIVEHCARIGLQPSIITHGQHIAKPGEAQRYEDRGLDDWLISLHGGSPASHDAMLAKEGSFDRTITGARACKQPVRFNSTLTTHNVHDLPHRWLADNMPPTVWNLINFNPFHVWSTKAHIDFQVRHEAAGEAVAAAVQHLESAGWEVNVRYWPLCLAAEHGYAENACGYHQVPYDPWEWCLNVTARTPIEQVEAEGGWEASERMRANQWMRARDNSTCARCQLRQICDKPTEQYQQKHGLGEVHPIVGGEMITDPLHYQRRRWEGVSGEK